MKQCDAKDGVGASIIFFDPMGCNFDPSALACKSGQTDACIPADKLAAIEKAFAGPKNSYGTQVYPGLLYDAGIASTGPIPGLLTLRAQPALGSYPTATEIDVDKDSASCFRSAGRAGLRQIYRFSGRGGKILFSIKIHNAYLPLRYARVLQIFTATNGGADSVRDWSRMFLVPGMSHCGGGPGLDQFDMLGAVVNWVEDGVAPDAVIATGRAFPGSQPPFVCVSKHAQYGGQGNTEDAKNFSCQ